MITSRKDGTTLRIYVDAPGSIQRKIFVSDRRYASSSSESGYLSIQTSNSDEFDVNGINQGAAYFITLFIDMGSGYGDPCTHLEAAGTITTGAADLTVSKDNNLQFVTAQKVTTLSVHYDYYYIDIRRVFFSESYDAIRVDE